MLIKRLLPKTLKQLGKSMIREMRKLILSGDNVICPICNWHGSRFIDTYWHEKSICPSCGSDIRHRLLRASFIYIPHLRAEDFLAGRQIIHFAPEKGLSSFFHKISARYVTADLQRNDVDLNIDISDMPSISSQSFDLVIACDVLEHVSQDKLAIQEMNRILRPGGTAIITVPQKDNLMVTYEDSAITTPEGRKEAFGESTHLRIYGADFNNQLKSFGFTLEIINDKSFTEGIVSKHVLKPPKLSQHPLATNYRNLFFCHKVKQPNIL
jgi:SAM-dependent methyltransferase